MKPAPLQNEGFTLIEMMLAVSIGSLMLAATMAASICLQRSFSAVDNYFASRLQQVRIIDYLSRDVRRSFIVTTSTDLQTVTCIIPNYLVDNGSTTLTIGALTNVVYSVVNKAIQRRENGGLTNIASSADNLIPVTSDVELLNTEFTQSTVTFLPTFAKHGDQSFFANERAGTTIFSLTYLRNRRRGDG